MKIRFVSSNPYKVQETRDILATKGWEVIPAAIKIHELQILDGRKLVEHKALQAFEQIGRPLFVEHTGLSLERLGGFPDGLTQIFWDRVRADRFCELFARSDVVAKTMIGYVDGRKIQIVDGTVSGKIAETPRGSPDFQWDCVFVPNGSRETFAELGIRKNDISMRRIALDNLAELLGKGE